VTTAHILLGVLAHPSCAGGLILRKLGVDLELARATTEFVLQYGRRSEAAPEAAVSWGGIPHTPAAKTVLDYAVEEANLFRPTYPIGTEHLLLGLLREPSGMGCGVLSYFGVEVHAARAARDALWDLLRTEE
jgi:ATP-dependent Clp protease ATP-binding subunit ClpC